MESPTEKANRLARPAGKVEVLPQKRPTTEEEQYQTVQSHWQFFYSGVTMHNRFTSRSHPGFKGARITVAAASFAGLAILGACSDGTVTSKVTAPDIPDTRLGVIGNGAVGALNHKVVVCVDPLSSAGSYNFSTVFNPDSSGFALELPSSNDPDLSGFGITQNKLGPYIPGDIITTPISLSPGQCADVFVRMTTQDSSVVDEDENRFWTGDFGTVNPSAAVTITATIPGGFTFTVQCTNDDPSLPQTDGCDAGPIVANPVVTSANVFHGSSATFLFTAPPPDEGCTFTMGWWKNKGAAIAAQFDFDGGTNNGLDVLNTQPNGNPYYILAHQYITAALNVQSGASMDGAALAAFNAATAYFAVASPGNPLPPPYTKSQVTGWAKTLDDYNSGKIGPGHCDD